MVAPGKVKAVLVFYTRGLLLTHKRIYLRLKGAHSVEPLTLPGSRNPLDGRLSV